MKKIMAVLLALVLMLSLAACGKDKEDSIIEIGDYVAEYKGYKFVTDYDGDDAIAIDFLYTNNSDEPNSFSWSFFYTITQDGKDLEYSTVFVDEDSYDTLDEQIYTEVAPGESLDVCITYKLVDTATKVEIEFSELIGNDEDHLTIDISEGFKEGSDVGNDNMSSSEVINWWSGDWYGWWTIFDGDGYYADYINEAWDCCAFVEPMAEGHLLTIWDEDYNDYYEDCLAEIMLDINPNTGVATSTGDDGYFWYGYVEDGELTIDPDDAGCDNMLVIEGSFIDDEGEYCEYGVVLTKFGYEWDENAVAAPDYYEYFLELMEEEEELPVVFEPTM